MITRIDQLADSVVSRLRTVVPAVWGVIVGQVLTWLVGRDWLPAVAAGWQAVVAGATVTVITGLCVWAVYTAARWVEAQQHPVARVIARVLLVVLKAPSYAAPVTPADPDQPAAGVPPRT